MAADAKDRVVIDTNILVSGYLFPQSIPGQAVDLCLSRRQLLMSIELISELASVLRREKFDRFLSRQRRDEFIAKTILESDFVAVSSVVAACRDSDDNKLLELAIDGDAAAVVTGDFELLVLSPFQGI